MLQGQISVETVSCRRGEIGDGCQTSAEELRSYFAALLKPQLPYVIRRSEAETFIVKGFRLLGI